LILCSIPGTVGPNADILAGQRQTANCLPLVTVDGMFGVRDQLTDRAVEAP
jgi:hypothetical protein